MYGRFDIPREIVVCWPAILGLCSGCAEVIKARESKFSRDAIVSEYIDDESGRDDEAATDVHNDSPNIMPESSEHCVATEFPTRADMSIGWCLLVP